jgi:hypothetical protein
MVVVAADCLPRFVCLVCFGGVVVVDAFVCLDVVVVLSTACFPARFRVRL